MCRSAFVPGVPGKQCDGKAGGERHVGRGGVRKSNHTGATSRNERAVQFTARPEAAQEKINGGNQQGRVKGGGHARSPVADAGDTERQHRLPVIQHWLFQPRFALQRRSNPIGAFEHFARHLRIAWFVGAEQAESPETIEEKESAERHQQQQVGAISRIRSLIHLSLTGPLRLHRSFRHRWTTIDRRRNNWSMSSRSRLPAPRAGDRQFAPRQPPEGHRANSRWRICARRHQNARLRWRHLLLLCCAG